MTIAVGRHGGAIDSTAGDVTRKERRSPPVEPHADAPVTGKSRGDGRKDDDDHENDTTSPGGGSAASGGATSTVPPVVDGPPSSRTGATPRPCLRDKFHDSTSSHPSSGNDELNFHDGASSLSASSSVRRVRVVPPPPHGGVVKVASDDDEDFSSDEDRASPTSVTAVPGGGLVTDPATTNRDPAQATAAAVGDGNAVEEELCEQLRAAEAQRQRMAANLRKKKAQLDEADGTRKDLEAKVADLEASMAKLQTENDQLRAGLQKVVTTRDEMKNKLRIKNELLRELRADKDDAERRLRRSENQRATEQDLLANYRRLATHTGYFKWGKTIRVLEAALEQHNASAEAVPAPGGNGSASFGGGNNNK